MQERCELFPMDAKFVNLHVVGLSLSEVYPFGGSSPVLWVCCLGGDGIQPIEDYEGVLCKESVDN